MNIKEIIQSPAVSRFIRIASPRESDTKQSVVLVYRHRDGSRMRSNTDPKWVLDRILAEHVKTGSFASLPYRVLDDQGGKKQGG